MLAAHDVVITNSRKAQHKLGELFNQGRHAAHTTSLEKLPETARLPGPDDPLGGREPKTFVKVVYKGQELLHAFGRGQQTRSVSYLQQSLWTWEGTSQGLTSTWQ